MADAELLPESPLPPIHDCKQVPVTQHPAYEGLLQTGGLDKEVIDSRHGWGQTAYPLKPLGQLQAIGSLTYKAKMVCYLEGHKNCFRLRNWSKRKEVPAAVDRALVASILEGRCLKPVAGQNQPKVIWICRRID